jgi:hypothetical protein
MGEVGRRNLLIILNGALCTRTSGLWTPYFIQWRMIPIRDDGVLILLHRTPDIANIAIRISEITHPTLELLPLLVFVCHFKLQPWEGSTDKQK